MTSTTNYGVIFSTTKIITHQAGETMAQAETIPANTTGTLTFTPNNWDTWQSVAVQVVDDKVIDNVTDNISSSVKSDDLNNDGMHSDTEVKEVSVANINDKNLADDQGSEYLGDRSNVASGNGNNSLDASSGTDVGVVDNVNITSYISSFAIESQSCYINSFSTLATFNLDAYISIPFNYTPVVYIDPVPIEIEDVDLTGTLTLNDISVDKLIDTSADTLNGGAVNDNLIGLGNDNLPGSIGTDSLTTSDGTNNVDSGTSKFADGVGNHKFDFNEDADLTGTLTLSGNSVDNLMDTGAGTDILNDVAGNDNLLISVGTDGDSADQLNNDTNNATINLTIGSNIVTDAATADNLLGGLGNDTIPGLTGNYLLTDGNDTDTLTGGTSSDTFDFNPGIEIGNCLVRDLSIDFSDIQLGRIGFFGIDTDIKANGDQDFTHIDATAFTCVAGQLDYFNEIIVDDTNYVEVADVELSIALVGSTSLVSTDFVL